MTHSQHSLLRRVQNPRPNDASTSPDTDAHINPDEGTDWSSHINANARRRLLKKEVTDTVADRISDNGVIEAVTDVFTDVVTDANVDRIPDKAVTDTIADRISDNADTEVITDVVTDVVTDAIVDRIPDNAVTDTIADRISDKAGTTTDADADADTCSHRFQHRVGSRLTYSDALGAAVRYLLRYIPSRLRYDLPGSNVLRLLPAWVLGFCPAGSWCQCEY
jgi:hypothetical protein